MLRLLIEVEVEKFHNGELKVKVVSEPSINFWKENLTWVPTFREIELIFLAVLAIDELIIYQEKIDAVSPKVI